MITEEIIRDYNTEAEVAHQYIQKIKFLLLIVSIVALLVLA